MQRVRGEQVACQHANPTFLVRRKNYATEGVSYTPQFSADLAAWANSTAVPVVLADDGVNQIVSVPFRAFIAGQNASFFRLSVSLAP